jgi:hypothetical protein
MPEPADRGRFLPYEAGWPAAWSPQPARGAGARMDVTADATHLVPPTAGQTSLPPASCAQQGRESRAFLRAESRTLASVQTLWPECRSAACPLGTTNGSATLTDAWHPVHRHDVARLRARHRWELKHRRCRNEAHALAQRHLIALAQWTNLGSDAGAPDRPGPLSHRGIAAAARREMAPVLRREQQRRPTKAPALSPPEIEPQATSSWIVVGRLRRCGVTVRNR